MNQIKIFKFQVLRTYIAERSYEFKACSYVCVYIYIFLPTTSTEKRL
jgi:hypothetical protein